MQLVRQIRSFIAAARPDPEAFETLAMALYAWQVAHNPDYAAIAAGALPRAITEIPTAPVGLFRDLSLCCFPPAQARYQFHTSGTSSGRSGVHRMRRTEMYDLAARTWFHACLPTAPTRAISLVPPPSQAPHSSLSHMVGHLFPDARFSVTESGAPDTTLAWRLLRQEEDPIFLASTALGLQELLLASTSQVSLPRGSLVMVTGGFKGRNLQVRPAALLAELVDRLGARVVGEYGMTELSSQLWTRPAPDDLGTRPSFEGPYLPPPWLRVIPVDPWTGIPVPRGQPGQLRFLDLANHDSVLAIETGDQGILEADGSVRLLGRLPGAPARGCSLTVEEAHA